MRSILRRLFGKPVMDTNEAALSRFLHETKSVIGVSPPFYIQITEDDSSRAYEDVILDVIRASGRPSPEQVNFTLGEILELDGKKFIEFKCMAGSVWCLIIQSVKRGTINRCLAHLEDRGGHSEITVIESK